MRKFLIKIIYAFCLVSFVLLMVVVFTIADSRIVRDKQYIHSTLLDLENTIDTIGKLNNSHSNVVDENREEIIQDVFETFSSAQYTIYAVVMKNDAKTIALSKNNVQEFIVNDGVEGQEYLDLLHLIAEGKKTFVAINHSLRLAQAIEEDDYFIVAYKDNSDLVEILVDEACIFLVFIVLCSGIIVAAFYRMMKKYIFDDLESVNRSIGELLHGNYAVEFEKPLIDELRPLVDAMERFKKVFLHKSERMDRILDVISPNIGVYECLSSTGLNFYSNSLWSILELDKYETAHFSNDAEDFKKFINSISKKKSEQDIIVYKKKHLEVHSYDVDGDYVGVVIDRTREEEEKIYLLNSLEEEKEKSLNDHLTGIRNRDGFKKEVENYINNAASQGVLLICDLDNFKRINDSLGHPEGDKVLKVFANCIKRQFRKNDILGRLGGDEFVVFLPNGIEKNILKDKLDAVITDVNTAFYVYRKYEIGVSIGVARIGEGILDYASLYEAADTALYVAKQMGKNQYFINEEGIRCMNQSCVHCRENCSKREAIEKGKKCTTTY